jgi:hypothetical protein
MINDPNINSSLGADVLAIDAEFLFMRNQSWRVLLHTGMPAGVYDIVSSNNGQIILKRGAR